MKDQFLRNIKYLRISVTDLCNLRCEYCMGKDGVDKKCHSQIMTPERIKEIVEVAVSLGITKIRLTGGEPLIRHGILDICRYIRAIKGVDELCITTNGVLLPLLAKPLKEAGVTRLNISLDSLNPEKYSQITRGGDLNDVLNGIKAAKEAGFRKTKINTVLIGGFNDHEIRDFADFAQKEDLDVRFIELMPIGESLSFPREAFISNNVVLDQLPELIEMPSDGVSLQYLFPSHRGAIGLISPLSHKFCGQCNRLRLTSDGKLKPCLHSSTEISLDGLSGESLKKAFQEAIYRKPKEHSLKKDGKSKSKRKMYQIGG